MSRTSTDAQGVMFQASIACGPVSLGGNFHPNGKCRFAGPKMVFWQNWIVGMRGNFRIFYYLVPKGTKWVFGPWTHSANYFLSFLYGPNSKIQMDISFDPVPKIQQIWHCWKGLDLSAPWENETLILTMLGGRKWENLFQAINVESDFFNYHILFDLIRHSSFFNMLNGHGEPHSTDCGQIHSRHWWLVVGF